MNKYKIQAIRLSEVMPYIVMFTFNSYIYWKWYKINENLEVAIYL